MLLQRRRRALLAATTAAAAVVATAVVAVTTAAAATGCGVTYTVASQWSGGFGANITVTNLGDLISGWTLTWSFPSGQQIVQGWNGTFAQSGAQVTVTDAGWNATIATGGTASVGFNGSLTSTTNTNPSSFTLNGVTCTGSASGSTAATPTRTSATPTRTSATPTSATPTRTTASATPSTAVPNGTLFVATNGSDGNAGTLAAPLATIQKAISLVSAGGTIAVRGGTYSLATNIQITKSGTSGAPITLTNYQSERVVIDGEPLPYTPGDVGSTIPSGQRGAIHMEASWWKIIGLEITHGPYAVYCNACNNNTFDRLVTHDNYETGFQLQGTSANNLILNLDSYNNRDPRKNGESADGLGIKEGSGSGNVVRGARLWNNVDDGFDAWMFTSAITIQNSITYGNGYNRWGIPNFAGDGNGFKLGGSSGTGPAANHAVSNSMSFSNSAHGFTDNGNTGTITVNRCTAYKNTKTGFDFDGGSTARLTANLAVGNATTVTLGSSTASGNSWNIGGTWNDAALLSTDSSTITGARAADGSIRSSNFLVPSNGTAIGAKI